MPIDLAILEFLTMYVRIHYDYAGIHKDNINNINPIKNELKTIIKNNIMYILYYYYQFFLCNFTFINLRTLPTAVTFPEILYGFSIILKTGNETA